MIDKVMFAIKLILIFLPFIAFQFLNRRSNYKKDERYKQYIMPIVSFVYFVLMFGLINEFYELTASFGSIINKFINKGSSYGFIDAILSFFSGLGVYIALVLISIAALIVFIFLKRFVLKFFKGNFDDNGIRGTVASVFYEYDKNDDRWYLKKSCSQMRTFIKVAYYAVVVLSALTLFVSYELYCDGALTEPFSPIVSVVVMGELAFFSDGLMKQERKAELVADTDNSRRISMYALLRKPLKKMFGDKLAAEGTTINEIPQSGGSTEDVLSAIEETGGHIGENYAAFIRRKSDTGLVPNVDYLRSGYDLASGKSLLFNTPFYDKLIPYAFYAVNRNLLTGNKVLVVMGRHGTEEDLIKWCQKGMFSVTNVPNLHKICVLSAQTSDDNDNIDIGIVSTSGVHDLDIHRANINFLKKVGFVIIVEPSRLVTTAQLGLNLLIKCCGNGKKITFCSIDRNCDGLVDALSHILMTNITEVSATEYPRGMSSFMCWRADDEHLQHRMIPGVSRYLGFGTELSFVALKNQVKQTVWYGGDVYPVLDAHWISKQYYYDFLKYANLPATQESFDRYFKTSFNLCNECVNENSYITVEDDRSNLFEARRNFATIAHGQSFINVISSEYMLREYMSDNTDIFTADAKAIPYITADYARTKRNSLLSLCLLLCVGGVTEKDLKRNLRMIGLDTEDPSTALWNEMYSLFSGVEKCEIDKKGNPVIVIESFENGKIFRFEKESTVFLKREYTVESGKFENVFGIENKDFASVLLSDLQNAAYIAELENEECYIGTELQGHVYQKYLPGQFFTMNGKYYEMISTIPDNKILVRRASEHISGRKSYRQLRRYNFEKIRNSGDMGELKTINNIDIHHLYVDFEVETAGYWELKSYNDFTGGSLVEINGIPMRRYYNKQVLKLDFSAMGELFSESVRKTLTILFNEVFVTLFAENQPFISAVTFGECDIPSTYSLDIKDSSVSFENCIFIIEDSQLDIGLLVAVERNIGRIMQIISDYLLWNNSKLESESEVDDALGKNDDIDYGESLTDKDESGYDSVADVACETAKDDGISKVENQADDSATDMPGDREKYANSSGEEGGKANLLVRGGKWFKSLFKSKNKDSDDKKSSDEVIDDEALKDKYTADDDSEDIHSVEALDIENEKDDETLIEPSKDQEVTYSE